MTRQNTTQEYTYLESNDDIALITSVTTGSLIISAWDGLQYVISDTITTTGTKIIFVKGQRLKFEPTGDMVYAVKAGN